MLSILFARFHMSRIPINSRIAVNKSICACALQERYTGNSWYLFVLFMPLMI